ncbi:hypothetical protein [Brachybacterium sillae]|uniref:hypothetical protein n=1 Tax=Brachybacterium sillae TaxID=2810536 RepID=UPI00217DBEA8|nr:hypothetical protein [Brachybacterium sillae]
MAAGDEFDMIVHGEQGGGRQHQQGEAPQGRRTERRPERPGRRLLLGGSALAVIGVGSFAACQAVGAGGGGSSDAGGGRRRGRTAKAPAATTPPPPEVAALTALTDVSAQVPDAGSVDLSERLGLPLSIPQVPGARGLDAALDICVSKLLRERHAAEGQPDLKVSGRIVASGPGLLGALLDVTTPEGSAPILVWHRAEGDRASLSPALIADDQWGPCATQPSRRAPPSPGWTRQHSTVTCSSSRDPSATARRSSR